MAVTSWFGIVVDCKNQVFAKLATAPRRRKTLKSSFLVEELERRTPASASLPLLSGADYLFHDSASSNISSFCSLEEVQTGGPSL
jgi:hypothetical protein